eukprot:CAMPEP_0176154966 /NCGR_PEP_ID=MMETSP0120_2-20121206/79173_1 /TAXON_ID=160619 /ORGANISM="Kryptoperidinium foliaceum, Strain CCMP 1326" /LENGTH=58 /DNA_ID=CAMNT_0017492079 /DNA_START=283 /DNA_END=456 /DNA_ORIENTATION=-
MRAQVHADAVRAALMDFRRQARIGRVPPLARGPRGPCRSLCGSGGAVPAMPPCAAHTS